MYKTLSNPKRLIQIYCECGERKIGKEQRVVFCVYKNDLQIQNYASKCRFCLSDDNSHRKIIHLSQFYKRIKNEFFIFINLNELIHHFVIDFLIALIPLIISSSLNKL